MLSYLKEFQSSVCEQNLSDFVDDILRVAIAGLPGRNGSFVFALSHWNSFEHLKIMLVDSEESLNVSISFFFLDIDWIQTFHFKVFHYSHDHITVFQNTSYTTSKFITREPLGEFHETSHLI